MKQHLFILILLFIYSCNNTVKESNNSQCDEFQYWEEVSGDNPYPGINCSLGPTKTIGVTFHVMKDALKGNWVVDEEFVHNGLDLLNLTFNQHGIIFIKRKINFIDKMYPENKDTLNEYLSDYFGIHDLNIIYSPGTDSGCSHPWLSDAAEKDNTIFSSYLHSCKIAAIYGSTAIAHETGHFFGLLHTFWPGNSETSEEWNIRGPYWVEPIDSCHLTGDYICDTSYDCFDNCTNLIGCEGMSYEYLDNEGGYGYVNQCDATYNPSTDNVMSYYYNKDFIITYEQGARARYYLMYRLNNNINGNILQLYD